MKVFIQELDVINWNDIGEFKMEFDEKNRNFVNVFQKNSIALKAISAVLGCELAGSNLPKNCVVKLLVSTEKKMNNQSSFHMLTKHIKIEGLEKILSFKCSTDGISDPVNSAVKVS